MNLTPLFSNLFITKKPLFLPLKNDNFNIFSPIKNDKKIFDIFYEKFLIFNKLCGKRVLMVSKTILCADEIDSCLPVYNHFYFIFSIFIVLKYKIKLCLKIIS